MAKGLKTGGRRPGTPNRITQALTEAIDTAFTEVGGAKYLVRVANDDPKSFCALLGKRLPRDMNIALRVSLADLIKQSVNRGAD
jgi:hypothetical protein